MKKFISSILLFILCFVLTGCSLVTEDETVSTFSQNETRAAASNNAGEEDRSITDQHVTDKSKEKESKTDEIKISLSDIPSYSGKPYVEVNGNTPYFTDSELSTSSYEYYPDLDSLGRCGTCVACIGRDIMPTEERGTIGNVKPSGWHTVKYSGIIDGNYLYNRCHLIAFQLSGENANTKNLITGTRYMNVEGMLPFENMVSDYVKSSQNHVMYRVTPIFEQNNLVADGVLIEAKSVEDNGRGIQFNVFCYNVQPGISIDYATGDSQEDGSITAQMPVITEQTQSPADNEPSKELAKEQPPKMPESNKGTYAVNANNGKIHMVGACTATGTGSNAMKNPVYFGTYEEAEAYSIVISPSQKKRQCGNCWK